MMNAPARTRRPHRRADELTDLGANPRERRELQEVRDLAPLARWSRNATRPQPEPASDVRTAFQRDRDRIVHSKSFRRLMHKTQVFIAPAGDHYRTRLTHTIEVSQIARTIGRALALNEDLIEAISMGHDLGHTPFGHAGETALQRYLPGFRHNEQSLRVVDILEKDGAGLNLTDDVRDGILHHSKPDDELTGAISRRSRSLEGEVMRISDAVAYINHDLDDAIRARIINEEQIPPLVVTRLGASHATRIDTLVSDIVHSSNVTNGAGEIRMSPETLEAANALRSFLFDAVYRPMNETSNTKKARQVVEMLCGYYDRRFDAIPTEFRHVAGSDPVQRIVADYVASMTDRYAVETFEQLYVPQYWALPSH
ncbi:MAG: deoxyguanosinetriphosphate triphosphohydrolase [Thermomicrobiales bacterium]